MVTPTHSEEESQDQTPFPAPHGNRNVFSLSKIRFLCHSESRTESTCWFRVGRRILPLFSFPWKNTELEQISTFSYAWKRRRKAHLPFLSEKFRASAPVLLTHPSDLAWPVCPLESLPPVLTREGWVEVLVCFHQTQKSMRHNQYHQIILLLGLMYTNSNYSFVIICSLGNVKTAMLYLLGKYASILVVIWHGGGFPTSES